MKSKQETQVPEIVHGFIHTATERIEEIKTDAFIYNHQKSGAKLLVLKNSEKNKTFQIAFRTPPTDDTGCPHILEHCVLNGSKNYPSKNTFTELSKGSLKTFLNAMTYSDKTLYPVASTNDADFFNLMGVYLDAVFFPNIYSQPEIFYQEGWHHELKAEDNELKIRGVVYNEMKGAFSSPESVLYRYCQQMQFPDNQYRYESGGEPDAIPSLSYEQFIEFHKNHYHPANSYIILFGDMDIDKSLQMLDEAYLSKFDVKDFEAAHKEKKGEFGLEIPLQKAFEHPVSGAKEYPVSAADDPKDKFFVAMNWTKGLVTDAFHTLTVNILLDVLMNSPASPLKQKIIASGLVEDSYIYVDVDCQQPTISLFLKHLSEEAIPQITDLVYTELKALAESGFDPKLVEAAIHKREFLMREVQMANMPQGVIYSKSVLDSWFYGGEPLAYLKYDPLFDKLRNELPNGILLELLKSTMIENKHHSVVTLIPVPGMNDSRDAAQKAELEKHLASLSAREKDELILFNQSFEAWQKEPEKQEDLLKIPTLALSDINPRIDIFPCEAELYKEFTLLKHPAQTNGIVYFKAYFDLAHAEEEDLPWISLLTYLCGKISTQNYTYQELANEINLDTGGIGLGFNLINDYQDPDLIIPKIILAGKAICSKVPNMIELGTEVALRTVFTDTDRIKALIREFKSRLEGMIMMRGSRIAINRMLSPISQYYHWSDLSSGLGMYHFLCKIEKSMTENISSVIEELEWVQKTFFSRNKLILSITAEAECLVEPFNHLDILVANVPTEVYVPNEHVFAIRDFNEAITAPVNVQFVAKGGNFFRKGFSYNGKLRVLNNILENEYLYQQIRVKGGAYGAFSSFSISGYHYCCSYRDPNLEETLRVYDEAAEFVRNFNCSRLELDRYIIGVISDLDYPYGPEVMAVMADEDYITDFRPEDRQQIRDEVLATRIEDIHAYADMVEAMMNKNHFCVFGNESKVQASAHLFDAITPLIQ